MTYNTEPGPLTPLPLTDDANVIHAIVIFSDAWEGLHWLANTLESEGFRIIGVITAEALGTLEQQHVSFVVLDAESAKLLPALVALRANPDLLHVTALVRAERINDLMTVAGLCPPYRALICYHEDLIQLVKHHAQHGQLPSYHERKHLI
jgi:hypothetical protein